MQYKPVLFLVCPFPAAPGIGADLALHRAEQDLSLVLTPRWHPSLGKEGVYDQLFDRTDACFTRFKPAASVSLCLLLPQDGIFIESFPSLAL